MSGLPREVLKWVQSLDLTWKVKTPKWDISNGYLVAEILSWYFPQEIHLHSFYNRNSLDLKQLNWYLLKNFIKSRHLDIPEEYIDGTIHCKEGAAALLLEHMYEILTNRKVKKVQPEMPVDFTDYAYQSKLPMHARSTAAKAIKNNLRITEEMADRNVILTSQKCQKIISSHIDHRRLERQTNPKRFDIKPTLGERCIRKPTPAKREQTELSLTNKDGTTEASMSSESMDELIRDQSDITSIPMTREPSVHFKEINVQQMDKSPLYNMPIHGF